LVIGDVMSHCFAWCSFSNILIYLEFFVWWVWIY
jgi:hypothetical protein